MQSAPGKGGQNRHLSPAGTQNKKYFFDFFQCPECGNVFWKGSHYDAMTEKFTSLGMFSKKE
ncbi:MAG: Mut7-C RNAse domain-containing protein [Desulfotignum sp.]|nr:Mut7-C RNAse domain-containing protein [Desulfotignum sp.]